MTTEFSYPPEKRPDGRGKHPNSRKNLIPYLPGHQGNKGNPYPITSELKDILRRNKGKRAKDVAETMILTACLPNSRSYSTALTQLLDRAEGKVPGDQPLVTNVNVVFVIGKGYRDAPQLTEEKD